MRVSTNYDAIKMNGEIQTNRLKILLIILNLDYSLFYYQLSCYAVNDCVNIRGVHTIRVFYDFLLLDLCFYYFVLI